MCFRLENHTPFTHLLFLSVIRDIKVSSKCLQNIFSAAKNTLVAHQKQLATSLTGRITWIKDHINYYWRYFLSRFRCIDQLTAPPTLSPAKPIDQLAHLRAEEKSFSTLMSWLKTIATDDSFNEALQTKQSTTLPGEALRSQICAIVHALRDGDYAWNIESIHLSRLDELLDKNGATFLSHHLLQTFSKTEIKCSERIPIARKPYVAKAVEIFLHLATELAQSSTTEPDSFAKGALHQLAKENWQPFDSHFPDIIALDMFYTCFKRLPSIPSKDVLVTFEYLPNQPVLRNLLEAINDTRNDLNHIKNDQGKIAFIGARHHLQKGDKLTLLQAMTLFKYFKELLGFPKEISRLDPEMTPKQYLQCLCAADEKTLAANVPIPQLESL